ncbi:MAG: hypothetical protein LBM02_04430 [Lachnospiraceae bacterium]|jgi:hypothetical protein|nr:hypothetical protein [Lachnospiraceae bacterium]
MDINQGLVDLFKDVYKEIPKFNKNSYEPTFKHYYEKHKDFISNLITNIEEIEEDKRQDYILELADVIPSFVSHLFETTHKTHDEVDVNMTMAVYVIPILNYSHNEYLERLCEEMVDIWNSSKVTNLNLSYSEYSDIDSGFKKRLCYITTCICEGLGKEDSCYELTTLREYRDNYLLKSVEGKELVEDYYQIAPVIVMKLNMLKDKTKVLSNLYEKYIKRCIYLIENKNYVDCKNLYKEMVLALNNEEIYA